MAYKIKSMLKQTSGTGLSSNYYLKQELNKFTDGNLEVMNPSNKGKSVADVTEKFTTPEIIKAKDRARERDEKKQIRKAGREAAKNAEVDFVKATPMGSDYFSLMAATAENIASRAGAKGKARKAAKEMKREQIRRSNILGDDAMESKPLKKITKDKSKDTRVPKKATKVVPNNFSVGKIKEEPTIPKSTMNTEFIERITTFPQMPTGEPENTMNTELIEGITTFPQTPSNGRIIEKDGGNKKAENPDPKYFYSDGTRKFDIGINEKTGKEYAQRRPSPASRAVGETIRGVTGSISSALTNPFPDEAVAKRKAKIEQARQKQLQRQKESELDLEEIKKIQGLPMMGDGFNKGMSRKNKYKK